MCCFSRAVSFVGGTKIFGRGLADGRQILVYAMNVELDEELAMILPLPVPVGGADDAVTFINLAGEERFFVELGAAFPSFGPQPAARSFGPPRQQALPVFDVGQFEASFVPTAADFGRLNARFRLPGGFLQALPRYADFGFAVFRLKPLRGRSKRQTLQPMALAFQRREPRAVFFPTVHVHDGSVPEQAAFDHALYCQADGVLERTLGWTRSTSALTDHVTGPKSRELLEARGGFSQALFGSLPNADVWLREPGGVALDDLHGGGDCYAFEIKATAAYAIGWQNTERAPWVDSASAKLGRLCFGLRTGLAELESSQRAALSLAPLSDGLPPHFMNGPQLWRGTDYMNGSAELHTGPGRIRFTPFSKLVEPQVVTLGFSRLPDPDTARAINAQLCELLDRALA